MGAGTSRELATEILENAEQGLSLEILLENPKWKRLYQESTPALRRSILHLTSAPKEDTLPRIQKVQKSDIGISDELRPYFELWKHPRNFFDHNTSVVAGEDTVSQVYVQLRRIVSRRIDDPIRARIYSVALFDLRLSLDKNESLQLRPEVKGKIQQVIFDSPLVNDSLEDISKWTKMFLKFGERMKVIAAGNGGLGALMVIPSSFMSLRQWSKLSNAKLDIAVQHLQSIEVAQAAEKAKAHTVADRIHNLILQNFIHGVESTDVDYDEQMVDSEDAEDDSTTNDSTDDSDCSSVNNHPRYRNASSISLKTSSQAVNPRRGCPQSGMGTVQQMTTERPVHHSHLASPSINQQATGISIDSPLHFLSEAANLVNRQDGHHMEGFSAVSPHNFQTASASLPQQRSFGTDPNQTSTNMSLDPLASIISPSAAWDSHVDSAGVLGHLWNAYSAPDETPIDPTQHNLGTYHHTSYGTLSRTEDWSSCTDINRKLVNSTEGNLWVAYHNPGPSY